MPARPLTGALRVALTFFYFLIFAEFAFLNIVKEVVPEDNAVRLITLCLGLGGVAGSLFTGWRLSSLRAEYWARWSFAGCSVGALWAAFPSGGWWLGVNALLIGASLGSLTVSVVAGFPKCFRLASGARWIGLGTGLAYSFSNLPWIFDADARVQSLWAAGASLLGCFSTFQMSGRAFSEGEANRAVVGAMNLRRTRAAAIALAAILVFLDSAAFYIIQQNRVLKSETWSGPSLLYQNAIGHLVLALVAGWLLDRGYWRVVWTLALAAISGACLLLTLGPAAGGVSIVYVSGVSLYSTALVAMAWLWLGSERDRLARTAGGLFALSGWLASGLGIGMAQDLLQIPWGVPLGALLIGGGLLVFLSLISREAELTNR